MREPGCLAEHNLFPTDVLAFSAWLPLVATWPGPSTTPRLRPLYLLSETSKSGKGEKKEMRDGALNLVIAVLMVIILVLLALRFF